MHFKTSENYFQIFWDLNFGFIEYYVWGNVFCLHRVYVMTLLSRAVSAIQNHSTPFVRTIGQKFYIRILGVIVEDTETQSVM